jgi:hypothetical protein
MPSASLALSLSLTLASTGASALSPKRGYVADGCTGMSCTDFSLLTGASWRYDYNYGDPNCGLSSSCPAAIANSFVPMAWCLNDVSATIPPYVNTSHALGFNEPNNAHNVSLRQDFCCSHPIDEALSTLLSPPPSTSAPLPLAVVRPFSVAQ